MLPLNPAMVRVPPLNVSVPVPNPVALAVESLIAVFHFAKDAPDQLPQAASIAVAAGVLLAAWGVFVHLNRAAEEIEPESMAATKREDEEVQAKEKE